MNFLDKLDFLMERDNLNKSTLSQKSNIPYTTIDGWYKKGYEGLKLTTLKKLCEFFNTTLDYFVKDDITDPNYGKTDGFKVNYKEMNFINSYRSLDLYGKKVVDCVIDIELERVLSSEKAVKFAARGGHIEMTEEQAINLAKSANEAPNDAHNKDIF